MARESGLLEVIRKFTSPAIYWCVQKFKAMPVQVGFFDVIITD
jgi:hypothetical protein